MEDKFEFDETEIRRIPDETTIMELKGKHYGGTVKMVFSILLFSGVYGVINYTLFNLYAINILFSICCAAFVSSFLYAIWKKNIANEEILIFFFLAVLGGSGEEHLKLLLDGNLIIIKYIAYSIMGIITGVKLGLTIVNKEAREVFKSRLMIVIFSLFFYNFIAIAIGTFMGSSIYRGILYFFIYFFIGLFISCLTKKISNICFIAIIILNPDIYPFLKSVFIGFKFISLAIILISLLMLYVGGGIGYILVNYKKITMKDGDSNE